MNKVKSIYLVSLILCGFDIANAQTEGYENDETLIPKCSSDKAPYNDFDFVVGVWDFFTPDGTKIGTQEYKKREQGCLIVEEWKMKNGGTGLGISYVDPNTGLWRQIWMSPMFHIDYSGKLKGEGHMVLEGTLFYNNSLKKSPVRGVWEKQSDGSIKQEFLVLNQQSNRWEILFRGYTLPKTK